MNKHVELKSITLVALFFFCSIVNGLAQENNISIKVKNASLKEVLNEIEKHYRIKSIRDAKCSIRYRIQYS